MRIERQLQDLLDTLSNLRSSNTELKEKNKELTQLLRIQQVTNKELVKQNKTLRKTDNVLDGLDEDRLFSCEARIDFQRTLDGMRILKVRSLHTGLELHTADDSCAILQQGIRQTLGRIECPAEV